MRRPLSRREFVLQAIAAAASPAAALGDSRALWANPRAEVYAIERRRVLRAAEAYLKDAPKTIVAVRSPRSPGGPHDFYSEGDYWWPDPKNPSGPYIRRDGESNPDNFVAHRQLLMRLSIQMPALAAAWVLTKRRIFAEHASAHLRAWFVDSSSRMNPNLEFAQAIHGIDTGRSIGIIDTLHLVEVAQAARVLGQRHALTREDLEGTRAWFADYLNWLTTSVHGKEERAAKNNHGSCWLLQAAAFAQLTGDAAVLRDCRERLRSALLPGQIAPDGSFPLELARTKPYSYSLFNLDVLGMCALLLSDHAGDFWTLRLPNGASLQTCFRFMVPFIEDKRQWPFRHDVEYFDDLPVRQPSLLFAGLIYGERAYLALWARLDPDPTAPEVIRNHPVRQPVLWMDEPFQF